CRLGRLGWSGVAWGPVAAFGGGRSRGSRRLAAREKARLERAFPGCYHLGRRRVERGESGGLPALGSPLSQGRAAGPPGARRRRVAAVGRSPGPPCGRRSSLNGGAWRRAALGEAGRRSCARVGAAGGEAPRPRR